MICFTNEQFVTELYFSISYFLKLFMHFFKILPAYIYLNIIWILMGYKSLNVLYQLDLSILEILFVYTIKMSPIERFSLSTHTLSPRFIMSLPDSKKWHTKGHVLVSIPWSGSMEGLDQLFKLNHSLDLSSIISFYVFYLLLFLWMVSLNK